MTGIWEACQGPKHIQPLRATVTRVVESQAQVATMVLVDTLDEQAVLEGLLEESKPPPPVDAARYHYLIMTPFRYPPLEYGSRFGSKDRSGIYYGSLAMATALAECAYYRLLFWSGMQSPPPNERLMSEHTSFVVNVHTAHGVALEQPPFAEHTREISDPQHYRASQLLGGAMRDAGVAAFTYVSARDPQGGLNIAIYTPKAIRSRKPLQERLWDCITAADSVAFVERQGTAARFHFPIEVFLINGALPMPVS